MDMDPLSLFVLFSLIASSTSFPDPHYEILYSDGWVPMTIDQAYNYIAPVINEGNNNVNIAKLNTLRTKPETAVVEKEIEVTNDDDTQYDDNCDGNNNCVTHKIKTYKIDNNFAPNTFEIKPNEENIKSDTKRQSKKLRDDLRINNKLFDIENEATNKNLNTYEVVEENLDDALEKSEMENKEIGYFYDAPTGTNNFINQLVEVLQKYNIRINDELPHYALSRRQKAPIPVKQESIKPLQVPFKYNSLNHLPVDPLLAVFLSNYGYYLQGQYGIQNNYNNHYGYLASNNIHNNKPFGVYKVFSDTDSSN